MACELPIFAAPADLVPALVVVSVMAFFLGAFSGESLRTPPWTLILNLPPARGSDAPPWQNFH
jgi:hypothetical protein